MPVLKDINILDLIDDAKAALKAESYFSALALTFALVSACANKEYPDNWFKENADNDWYLKEHFSNYYSSGFYKGPPSHDKERFIMWIDDWENHHVCDDTLKDDMIKYEQQMQTHRQSNYGLTPEINGELLYQLRCSLFHNASDEIDFNNHKKITDHGNQKLVRGTFGLSLDPYNPLHIHIDYCSGISSTSSSLNININALIYKLLHYVQLYYSRNISKFETITVYDNREENHYDCKDI